MERLALMFITLKYQEYVMPKKNRQFLVKHFDVAKKIPYRYEKIEDYPDVMISTIKPIKALSVSRESCKFLLIVGKNNKIYLYYPFEKSLEEILLPNTAITPNKPLVMKQNSSDKKRLFAYTTGTLVLLYENSIKFFRNGVQIKSKTYPSNIPQKIIGLYGKFYLLLKNKNTSALNVEIFDFNGRKHTDITEDVSFFDETAPTLEGNPSIKSFGYDCLMNLWTLDSSNTLNYYEKQDYHKKNHNLDEIVFPTSDTSRCEIDLIPNTDTFTTWSDLRINADMPEGTSIFVEVNDGTKTDTYTNTLNIPLYGYVGKQLKVNIRLKSSPGGTLSPTLYSVKVTINQIPYVEHLPAYYQENQETLNPYLSIFQNLMDGFEEQIEKSHLKMLDPLCCDEEYLGWLSSLLGIARDYRWPEEKWRKFLDEAPTLYAGLGTKASMVRAIELYYGEEPEIKDDYGVSADESETCDSCKGNNENCWFFCVSLHEKKIDNQRDAEVIASIIEAFKPAHTSYKLLVGYGKEAFVLGESFLDKSTQI